MKKIIIISILFIILAGFIYIPCAKSQNVHSEKTQKKDYFPAYFIPESEYSIDNMDLPSNASGDIEAARIFMIIICIGIGIVLYGLIRKLIQNEDH